MSLNRGCLTRSALIPPGINKRDLNVLAKTAKITIKDSDFLFGDGGQAHKFHFLLSKNYKSHGFVISLRMRSGFINHPEFDKYSKSDKISEL